MKTKEQKEWELMNEVITECRVRENVQAFDETGEATGRINYED